jgi:hypothetical protein
VKPCPVSPDRKHTFIHGRCIECDAFIDRNDMFQMAQQEMTEFKMQLTASRLVGRAAR